MRLGLTSTSVKIGPVPRLRAVSAAVVDEYESLMRSRRYDGPLGKSDRAFLFGALGLWLGWVGKLPNWAFWIAPISALAILLNTFNRIRSGVRLGGHSS